MSYGFELEVQAKSASRNRKWYHDNLMRVLQHAKEKQTRDINVSIALAEKLLEIWDEPLGKAIEVPLRTVEPSKDDSLMKPIEEEELNIFLGSEKGCTEEYLKARNKKAPEDKYYFRLVTSWDYGWQQKQSRQRARDVNRGRCFLLKHTFYRRNNAGPDPPHYAQPSGGEVSICSEYSCNFS